MIEGRAGHPDSDKVTGLRLRIPDYVADEKWRLGALIVGSVVIGLCESAILALVALLASALVDKHPAVTAQIGPIHVTMPIAAAIWWGMAAAVLRMGLQGLICYLPARIAAGVQLNMRRRLFKAFARASWAVQSRGGEGEFQELLSQQTFQASWVPLHFASQVIAGCTLAILVASALLVQAVSAMVVIAAAGILFWALRPLNVVGQRHATALSATQVELAAGVSEAVTLAEESKVFGVNTAQESRIEALIEATQRTFFTTQFLSRFVPGVYQSVVFLLLIVGLGVLYLAGGGQLASLGAVVLLLIRASAYGQQLQGASHLLHQYMPYMERVHQAESQYISAKVTGGTGILSNIPTICMQDVSYAYDARQPVLRHVTFRVEPGEAVGIVGPTGAGKSTLVQMLLGLREPTSGQLTVDECDATAISLSEWARAFSYVPQEPKLLHASVADNIRFYRELENEDVERAARLAHIHDDIMSWPRGYDTIIGLRADAVSGGQRQRICLARALAARPKVLVLDEPTSQLDPRSESLVQASLNDLKGRATLFVVAHRFSTLDICDRIMVIKDGQLEVFGSPDEVARASAYFRNASEITAASS